MGLAPVNCYPNSSLQYGLQAFSSGILPRAVGNEEDIFGLQSDIFVTAIQNFLDRDRNGLADALDLANDLGPIQSGHWTIPTGERQGLKHSDLVVSHGIPTRLVDVSDHVHHSRGSDDDRIPCLNRGVGRRGEVRIWRERNHARSVLACMRDGNSLGGIWCKSACLSKQIQQVTVSQQWIHTRIFHLA